MAGVDGYAFQFDQNPNWTCDQIKDVEETVTTANSPSLTPGTWYFHVCSVDNLGNWSPTASQGPYVIIASAAIPTLSPLLLALLAVLLVGIALLRTGAAGS